MQTLRLLTLCHRCWHIRHKKWNTTDSGLFGAIVFTITRVILFTSSHLVETANSWLRRNSHWKLINCETVRLSYRHNLTNVVSRWEQQINPATAMWNGAQLRTGEYETTLKVLRFANRVELLCLFSTNQFKMCSLDCGSNGKTSTRMT